MPKVHFGSKDEPGFDLELSDNLIAVRTRSGRSITRTAGPVPAPLSAELEDSELIASYPEAGVEVYRVPTAPASRSVAERKAVLRASPDVRFAGGVLIDPATHEPVLYTENLFVKFKDAADPDDCKTVLRDAGLTVKEEVSYAANAYFVSAAEGSGQKVFDIATKLLQNDDVEYCHPELIRPRTRKGLFEQQWHLKKTLIGGIPIDAHANIAAAHDVTQGEGTIIAIIDDGVDIDHLEFGGSGKIVAPRDATN
ncbi:MAG: S8 family serine peptidase, partial [Gammaproteobacteria bacterium]